MLVYLVISMMPVIITPRERRTRVSYAHEVDSYLSRSEVDSNLFREADPHLFREADPYLFREGDPYLLCSARRMLISYVGKTDPHLFREADP